MDGLWSRLSIATKAFLAVGVSSTAYLVTPLGRPATTIVVYACVAVAGFISIWEVAQTHKSKGQPSKLTTIEFWVARGLEVISIVVGLMIITGIL